MSYLAEILCFAEAGNAIFPCSPETKAPLTAHGFHDCTTDLDTIREWWRISPTALVGRPEMGKELTIDVDRQHGGFIAFKEIMSFSPAIQETFARTLSVQSRSGGGHIKLLNPENYDIKSAAGSIWKGIDFKTAGKGYLIVPPSPGYRYLNASPRLDVPREFWELYQATIKQTLQGRPAPFGLSATTLGDGQPIPEGQRNSTLLSLAGRLRRMGLTEESIFGVVFTENESCCNPPLPLNEVQSIVRSVMNYPSGSLYIPSSSNSKDAAMMISRAEERSAISSRSASENVRPVVQRLRDIAVKDYQFFWHPYMAFGTVTALSAKGGTGKGTLTNFLVALTTSGRLAEVGPTDVVQPLNVLIFSKEDSPGAKIRPEVELAGGNIDRVFVCNKLTNDAPFTFSDAEAFDAAFAEAFAGQEYGLTVVDNAGDFGDSANDGNNYKAVTQELTVLTDLAQKYNVAVLLIMHENRSGSFMGSAAYENKVRSHCSYKRTDEENVCIFTHEKKNFFHGKPMLFGATSVDVAGLKYPVWKVHVVGEADLPPNESSVQRACTEWLRGLVQGGPIGNPQMMQEAEARGFEKHHVTRARTQIAAGIIRIGGVNHTAMPVHIAAAQLEQEAAEIR